MRGFMPYSMGGAHVCCTFVAAHLARARAFFVSGTRAGHRIVPFDLRWGIFCAREKLHHMQRCWLYFCEVTCEIMLCAFQHRSFRVHRICLSPLCLAEAIRQPLSLDR